jgi:hypothetical protein
MPGHAIVHVETTRGTTLVIIDLLVDQYAWLLGGLGR